MRATVGLPPPAAEVRPPPPFESSPPELTITNATTATTIAAATSASRWALDIFLRPPWSARAHPGARRSAHQGGARRAPAGEVRREHRERGPLGPCSRPSNACGANPGARPPAPACNESLRGRGAAQAERHQQAERDRQRERRPSAVCGERRKAGRVTGAEDALEQLLAAVHDEQRADGREREQPERRRRTRGCGAERAA